MQAVYLTSKCLARKAVRALEWEAKFSPKPGLVDSYSNGAHQNMTLDLFIRSAKSLEDSFYQMAENSRNLPLGIILRKKIGYIGRQAEKQMFFVTNGVNTHKGDIWLIGLLVSAVSHCQSVDYKNILEDAQKLAQISDPFVPKNKTPTYGQMAKDKYAFSGARGEAQNGFPNLKLALKIASQNNFVDKNIWLKILLSLYSKVDDTNIVHRSNLKVLRYFQKLSRNILESNLKIIKNPKFKQLDDFVMKKYISPGGSADLFSACYFLVHLKMEKQNGKIII